MMRWMMMGNVTPKIYILHECTSCTWGNARKKCPRNYFFFRWSSSFLFSSLLSLLRSLSSCTFMYSLSDYAYLLNRRPSRSAESFFFFSQASDCCCSTKKDDDRQQNSPLESRCWHRRSRRSTRPPPPRRLR